MRIAVLPLSKILSELIFNFGKNNSLVVYLSVGKVTMYLIKTIVLLLLFPHILLSTYDF